MALTTNIVSYYKLDGNSNDSVASNNGANTTITFSTGNGIINQGAGFGGASNIIFGTVFNSTLDSAAWTLNFWAKPSSIATASFLMAVDNSAGVRQFSFGFSFDMTGAPDGLGKLYFERAGTPLVADTGLALTTSFQMISATYDGTNLRLYINGSIQSTTAMTALPSSTNPLYWGQRQYPANEHFYTGAMDEVGIWSRTLSGTELVQLYNGGTGLQYPFILPTSNSNFFEFM